MKTGPVDTAMAVQDLFTAHEEDLLDGKIRFEAVCEHIGRCLGASFAGAFGDFEQFERWDHDFWAAEVFQAIWTRIVVVDMNLTRPSSPPWGSGSREDRRIRRLWLSCERWFYIGRARGEGKDEEAEALWTDLHGEHAVAAV